MNSKNPGRSSSFTSTSANYTRVTGTARIVSSRSLTIDF